LRAYCFTVARNAIRQERRHARIVHTTRRDATSSPDPSVAGVAVGSEPADAQLVHNEEQARIAAAVAALPERMREVFLLRWYGGLSYAEIARTMGTSVKTVDNQLARALWLVRNAVGELPRDR
jgi:RNA polymerase sigma-70 factor (ECF subfamily)